MTDLLSRPTETQDSDDGAVPRPLGVGAAVAGAASSLGTLFALMTVCIVGWFLADAGAHGQTTDALRVGADLWLVGHGSGIVVGGTPFQVIPLALTGAFAYAAWRAGRWAAATCAPPEDDRALALAGVAFSGVYVVVAVVTTVLASSSAATPQLGRAIAGALVVSLAGVLGLASGTGRLGEVVDLTPPWARGILRGAAAGFLALLAVAGLLLVVRLGLRIGDAATMLSALQLQPGDYAMYGLATLTVVPNAVLLTGAYLLGPGFAVGTGTAVSPGLVSLGPVPAFPLFAGLPADGATPAWAMGLMALPVLAGAAGGVHAQRSADHSAYDTAALRGFGGGIGAALLATLAIAASGGAVGTGRMADLGAPVGEVLVAAVVAMSLGGVVAAVATAWWQRRHGVPAEADASDASEASGTGPPDGRQDGWEDTVEVPLLGEQSRD